jgi:hypothetical protein
MIANALTEIIGTLKSAYRKFSPETSGGSFTIFVTASEHQHVQAWSKRTRLE